MFRNALRVTLPDFLDFNHIQLSYLPFCGVQVLMNYEQLYAYLDTRPLEEIKECMDNVVNLVRKYDPKLAVENAVEDTNKSPALNLHKLHVAQQMWTQQAVWNKFGSETSSDISPDEVAEAASHLLTTKEVAQYVVYVNEQIENDSKMPQNQSFITTATPSSISSDISFGQTPYQLSESRDHLYDSQSLSNIRIGSKRTYERRHPGRPPSIWNEEMDVALLAAVAAHKDEGWAVVAEHMDGRATSAQCANRWHGHVGPNQTVKVLGARWTDGELQNLERLVAKHTIEPYWSDGIKATTRARVDWIAIGKEIGRVPRECSDKWLPIALAKRTNTFTPQDDALILRREKEWGDKGVGLWAALEKEMKRPERNIRRRWKELAF